MVESLIGFILVALIGALVYKYVKSVVFPPVIMAALWALLLLWLCIGGNAYYPVTLTSVVCFVSAVAFFSVGGLIVVVRPNGGIAPFSKVSESQHFSEKRRRFIGHCIEAFIVVEMLVLPFYITEMLKQASAIAAMDVALGLRSLGSIEKTGILGGTLSQYNYITFAGDICAFASLLIIDNSNRSKIRTILAISLPLVYSFFTLGRTPLFMMIFGGIGILLIQNRISPRKILIPVILVGLILFSIPAMLRAERAYRSGSPSQIGGYITNSLTYYAIAPLVAFDLVINDPNLLPKRIDNFSFFKALSYRVGISKEPPESRIGSYVYTPLPTNVYPIYTNLMLEYGYVGLVFGMFYLGWFCSMIFMWAKNGSPTGTVLFGLVVSGVGSSYIGDAFLSSMSMWFQAIIICLFLFRFPLVNTRENGVKLRFVKYGRA